MVNSDCVFCKIIQKQIPAKVIKENDQVLIIEDIAPKAPIHYLILPKKHIINLNYIEEQDLQILWYMLRAAKELAKTLSDESGEPLHFNIISNNGENAGQCVFHMHWHFIAGKDIYANGLKL